MLSKRFYGPALLGAVLAIPVFTGCSDENNPLCCTEFKVGANIEGNIGGSAQSKVAVQAVADFAGIASAAIEDLTTACRSIATDLEVPDTELQAAEANTNRQAKMKAYCTIATAKLKATVTAAGSLTIKAQPPVCEASFKAKANCQASCSGSASCDVKATPPTCEGGKLEVACKGECTAQAGAKLTCEGSCSGSCTGSCTASGGVQCAGKCEGTCEGNTAEGSAAGECRGTCKGTCSATAPNVQCQGSCKGECSASCKAEGSASVKCDGKCNVDAEPIKCNGGELKGGCQVEAKCDANCNASVSAKAECTPPSIDIQFRAVANADIAGKLSSTLKANLGVILAFKSRLEAMVEITTSGDFAGNVKAVVDIKAACIPPVIAAVGSALDDVKVAGQATVDLAGSVPLG